MPGAVVVTFYDNFRMEDTSHVSLSTVESGGDGVDIAIFASAGQWEFTFGYMPSPGEDDDLITIGPLMWNISAAALEAAIEAAFASEHPTWVCNVEIVDGIYEVRFGTGDLGDPRPNAYNSDDISLSGYFSEVWDEHPHLVGLEPDPGDCGAGADPEEVPEGDLSAVGLRGGSVVMPHPCSGGRVN